MAEPTVSDAVFWEDLYARGRDGWDLGRANPVLGAHLARQPPPLGTVAVPGCGRGHDARFLARRGYRTLGFDFVPEIVREARELAVRDRVDVVFEERDVFELAAEYPARFDGVWEYTCFCAIDPARRSQYVDVLARILKPSGWLLACFFPMDPPGTIFGGPPPFPVKQAEIHSLLAGRFDLVEDYVPFASVEGRRGCEWMVSARRRETSAA